MANGFTANSAISTLRSIPRLGHGKDISQILSSDRDEQLDYVYGIIFLSLILFIILLAWCIILLTLSCLGSKRVGFLSGKHFIQPENTKGTNPSYYRPFIVRLTFIFFGLSALISCALLVTRGSEQYDNTVESFRNNTLAISELVSESNEVTLSLIEIGQDAQRIRASALISIENFCPNIDFEQDFGIALDKDEIIASLGALSDFVVDQSTSARNELILVEDALATAESVLDTITRFKGSVLYVVFPLGIITTVLLAGTLLACGGFTGRTWECLQTILFMRLLLIVSIVFWTFGSVFVLVGLVNADFCSGGLTPKNPDSTAFEIMDRFSIQENEPELYDILEHYIFGCETSSPFNFLYGYKGELVMAIMNINVLLESIEETTEEELTLLCGASISNEIAIVKDFKDILNELNNDIDEVLNIIDCNRINSIYVDAVHTGICHNLPIATTWIFSFLLAIGLCGMIMVTLRASWLEAEYTYSEEEEAELDVASFMQGGSLAKSSESRKNQDGVPYDVNYNLNCTTVSALTTMEALEQDRAQLTHFKQNKSSRSWEDNKSDENSYANLVPVNMDDLSAALKSV